MNDFYASDVNFLAALKAYLSLFSEGQEPIVPQMGITKINRAKTLDLPCYAEFPESARDRWLEARP